MEEESPTDAKVNKMVEQVRKAGQKQPSTSEILEEIREEEESCREIRNSVDEAKKTIRKEQEEIRGVIQRLCRKGSFQKHV